MSRQCMPHVRSCLAADQQQLLGVSAFAFQGTNAHVLLSCLPPASSSAAEASSAGPETFWQRTRFWLAPKPHLLLPSVLWLQQQHTGLFECGLDSAAAAVLWQHQVGTTSNMWDSSCTASSVATTLQTCVLA